MLSQERLKSLINYCPETGAFTWKVSRGCVKEGSPAGTVSGGYLRIKICGKSYQAHRLVVLYVMGYPPHPDYDVDHKDRDKLNNRVNNLRLASREANALNAGVSRNNALGVSNVRQLKDTGKYQVRVRGKSYGCYVCLEDAVRCAEGVLEMELELALVDGTGVG